MNTVASNGDVACNFCIKIITVYANNLDITYGEANILLFVILMPIVIFLLLLSTVFHKIKFIRIFGLVISIIILLFMIITLTEATIDLLAIMK